MEKIKTWELDSSVSVAEVNRFPDDLYTKQLKKYLLTDYPMLPWRENLTDGEVEKVRSLSDNLKGKYFLRLALLKEDELIGWSIGWQDSVDEATFYMAASLVLPAFRQKKYYSRLVGCALERTKDRGFQSVSSRHVMTNNPVLIAKMKLGFIVSGFEVTSVHGALIRLTYHHSEPRRAAARFRAGAIGETEVLRLLRQSE